MVPLCPGIRTKSPTDTISSGHNLRRTQSPAVIISDGHNLQRSESPTVKISDFFCHYNICVYAHFCLSYKLFSCTQNFDVLVFVLQKIFILTHIIFHVGSKPSGDYFLFVGDFIWIPF